MAILNCNIPSSLLSAVEAQTNRTVGGLSHLVAAALSQYLDKPI